MMGRNAIAADGLAVLFGGIGHVAVPAVLGIVHGQASHIFVAVGLGQDAGGGDGLDGGVAFDHGVGGRIAPGREAVAVDQDEIGFDRKLVEGAFHAFDRGVELDDGPQFVALRLGQLFGVVEQRMGEAFRQDDGGGEDGAGEAAAAGFVAAGYERAAAGEQRRGVGHAARRVGLDFGEGIDVGDAGLFPDGNRQRAAAADDQGFLFIGFAEGQDARDEFSVEALGVEAAFAGDDGVGLGDFRLQAGHFAEEAPAGHEGSAQLMKGRTHAACRAASRQHRIEPRFCRKRLHPSFQPLQHRRIRPLLRPIHHRRPIGPEQRIVHITGNNDRCFVADPANVRRPGGAAGSFEARLVLPRKGSDALRKIRWISDSA